MKYKTIEDMAIDDWVVTVVKSLNRRGQSCIATAAGHGERYSYKDKTRNHAVGRLLSRANLYASEYLS